MNLQIDYVWVCWKLHQTFRSVIDKRVNHRFRLSTFTKSKVSYLFRSVVLILLPHLHFVHYFKLWASIIFLFKQEQVAKTNIWVRYLPIFLNSRHRTPHYCLFLSLKNVIGKQSTDLEHLLVLLNVPAPIALAFLVKAINQEDFKTFSILRAHLLQNFRQIYHS